MGDYERIGEEGLNIQMLTSEQQKWVDHLSDTDTISIVPFDQTAEEKFIFVRGEAYLMDFITNKNFFVSKKRTIRH